MEKAYPFDSIYDDEAIRKLALNPGENEDPITCTLSLVTSEADFDYEALSYTWDTESTAGTQQEPRVISCSGHEMLMRENLFTALRRLRYPDRPRSFWVDAICINQGCIEEKNQQVALMGGIYANAKQVIIWLGEEEAHDALAFDTIRRLGRILKNEPEYSDLLRQMFNSKGGPDEFPMSDDNGWRALIGLLTKRWFSRAWIVQEAALARTATLVCGDSSLDFETFLNIYGVITVSSLWGILSSQGYFRGGLVLLIISIVVAKREEQESLDLSDLLAFTNSLQATDPRDKIFSLLGILKVIEYDTEHEEAKKSWSPDYNILLKNSFGRSLSIVYLMKDVLRYYHLLTTAVALGRTEIRLRCYLGIFLQKLVSPYSAGV